MKTLLLLCLFLSALALAEDANVYFSNGITAEASSGPQQFPAGTAAAPSINFGDPSTGIYSDSTNSISISSNGSSVVQFSAGALNTANPIGTTSFPVYSGDFSTAGGSITWSANPFQANIATYGRTAGVALKGTPTNDNASSGYVGEYLSSLALTPANVPSSGAWGDCTSFSLGAGDWDINYVIDVVPNGATITNSNFGIGTASGASATGIVAGDNSYTGGASGALTALFGAVSNFRVSLAGTTTYYGKANLAYSAATPQMVCRISARRVR